MADDIFDPSLSPEPFDLSAMMPQRQTVQSQAPPATPSVQKPKRGLAADAVMAAVMPIIARRYGPSGIAGMMRGYQQAELRAQQRSQQDFQNQRLTAGDQRAIDQQRANEAYRQQTLGGNLWKEATGALASTESPDAIGPLLDLYKARMGQIGMRDTGALDRYAQSIAAPSRFEQKAAEKYIANLEKLYGTDWAQKVGTATFKPKGVTLPVGPDGQARGLTVQELLGKVGTNIEGLPVKPANERQPIPGSFEDFTTTTDPAVRQRILDDRKVYNQADDKGTDPTVQALRELTLQQKQAAAQAAKSGDNLSPRQQQQVSAQARTFESLPVVKNTQKMSEAVAFANSLDPNTKNPADDQALIYAFAKAMDPDSVVREGEYATVQHYAQSWAESFQFNAARIFSNTAFLTPQARANMKRTIQQKFKAAQAQYGAVRDSYVRKINKITNLGDGADWLTDYGAAFPADPGNTAPAQAAPSPAKASAHDKLNKR